MSKVELNLSKKLFSQKLYPLLFDYSHRWEMYKGSAGSGKSYFITQKIIIRCIKEPIKVVVCRRYGSTIRNSCFALFKEILDKWQITPYVKIRETDFNIKFENGSEIIFIGLDEETKLLSLSNISTIFVEEVFEVPQSTLEQLNLRMRGNAPNQQIICAFNPISKNHYLYDMCVVNPPQSFYFSETTYIDNPFLSKEYIETLEDLKVRNPSKARIYCFGEWGVEQEGLVFTNWRTEDFDVNELAQKGYENRCGIDFGFIDKTAIIPSLYDKHNKVIYVYDEFYKSGQQLDEIYQAIVDMNLSKTKMYCDSADARALAYLKSKYIPAYPCIKGAGSVEARISFLQNHLIIVHPSCRNMIMELENFAYEKDKKTGQYTEKTLHEFSHACDALGYAYSDIYTKHGLRTYDKSVLGL